MPTLRLLPPATHLVACLVTADGNKQGRGEDATIWGMELTSSLAGASETRDGVWDGASQRMVEPMISSGQGYFRHLRWGGNGKMLENKRKSRKWQILKVLNYRQILNYIGRDGKP